MLQYNATIWCAPIGGNGSHDAIVSLLLGRLSANSARSPIFTQDLALYNKNNRVLLSQALCVIGSLRNLMFKLYIIFVVNIKFPQVTYQTNSAFDRRTLLFK